MNAPLNALRHHATGAIERGEAGAITEIPARKTRLVIVSKCAKMPSSCWGKYRRVALMRVTHEWRNTMISPRAKGVVEVVCTWEKLNYGKTNRCAYRRAMIEADALREKLEAQS